MSPITRAQSGRRQRRRRAPPAHGLRFVRQRHGRSLLQSDGLLAPTPSDGRLQRWGAVAVPSGRSGHRQPGELHEQHGRADRQHAAGGRAHIDICAARLLVETFHGRELRIASVDRGARRCKKSRIAARELPGLTPLLTTTSPFACRALDRQSDARLSLVLSCLDCAAWRDSTGGRTRTDTPLRALDFESSASANSATPA